MEFLADNHVLKCYEHPLLKSVACTVKLAFKVFSPSPRAVHQNLIAKKKKRDRSVSPVANNTPTSTASVYIDALVDVSHH